VVNPAVLRRAAPCCAVLRRANAYRSEASLSYSNPLALCYAEAPALLLGSRENMHRRQDAVTLEQLPDANTTILTAGLS